MGIMPTQSKKGALKPLKPMKPYRKKAKPKKWGCVALSTYQPFFGLGVGAQKRTSKFVYLCFITDIYLISKI